MVRVRARDAIETISAPASAWILPLVIAATQFWLGTAALTGRTSLGAVCGWRCAGRRPHGTGVGARDAAHLRDR